VSNLLKNCCMENGVANRCLVNTLSLQRKLSSCELSSERMKFINLRFFLALLMLTSYQVHGQMDLSGMYDVATLTPIERPEEFGDNLFLSPDQAKKISAQMSALLAADQADSDPDREAPPPGGDGSAGAAGNVGGYNTFWIDNGDSAAMVDGKFRTSIITSPSNGRYPPRTELGQQRLASLLSLFGSNTGTAWWLDRPGPGPYDDMEQRPLGERCLLGFSSSGGPPMLPALYNNMKRIVQTPSHVLIFAEMIHDARIVRINSQHRPAHIRSWMGDSIGWWEDDTLVIDTTNFRSRPALYGAGKDLHVVERISRTENGDLNYKFSVSDPGWSDSWSGEYPWPASDEKAFEYACHEGNYSFGNIMRGARILEKDVEQGE